MSYMAGIFVATPHKNIKIQKFKYIMLICKFTKTYKDCKVDIVFAPRKNNNTDIIKKTQMSHIYVISYFQKLLYP